MGAGGAVCFASGFQEAVAEAAGARVTETDGAPLLYGKTARGYDNPYFVVWGDVTVPT